MLQTRSVRPWLTDARRQYPFVQPDGRSYEYNLTDTPTHQRILADGIMLGCGRFYTDRDIDETAAGLHKVFAAYKK